MALSTGWEQSAVEEIVRDVLINLIDPYVYQEALDLIALHKALGREVYVVSSSPEEVVKPLAEHFGVSGVIATRAEIVDGKYTGQLERYAYAEGKARRSPSSPNCAGSTWRVRTRTRTRSRTCRCSRPWGTRSP